MEYQRITVILDSARPLRPTDMVQILNDRGPEGLAWYVVIDVEPPRDTLNVAT